MVVERLKHASAARAARTHSASRDPAAAVALAQGGYYLVTGLWPIVSLGTFERVSGPKTDHWLVQTVGGLTAVIGATLGLAGLAGLRNRHAPELALLAMGSAATFATIDTVYALRGRIAPVYLLDAVVEGGLLAMWMVCGTGKRGARRHR